MYMSCWIDVDDESPCAGTWLSEPRGGEARTLTEIGCPENQEVELVLWRCLGTKKRKQHIDWNTAHGVSMSLTAEAGSTSPISEMGDLAEDRHMNRQTCSTQKQADTDRHFPQNMLAHAGSVVRCRDL
jgi:hypothetical protein